MGELAGACGSGFSDWRTLLYVPEGLTSMDSGYLLVEERANPVASLSPRLWPTPWYGYAVDPFEETVLVRLGGYGLEEFEYAEEPVDALEAWRKGLGEVAACPSRGRLEYW